MDKRKELLSKIQLFVLDMDGTFYLGEQILEGSLEFLEVLKHSGKQYIFLTNNSSKSPELYIQKLAKMNCHISNDQIITSGDIMIHILQQEYPDQGVYLLGTPSLQKSFHDNGIVLTDQQPAVVVVGFDTTLTYEKLETACTFIREGVPFLATHLDINCPTEHGYIPDCGAICAAITSSTGVEPRYVGKPYIETLNYVLSKTNLPKEQIAFVGDRIYTDVATGVTNGSNGFLVLTGEAQLKDIEISPVKPTLIFESLKEIGTLMH